MTSWHSKDGAHHRHTNREYLRHNWLSPYPYPPRRRLQGRGWHLRSCPSDGPHPQPPPTQAVRVPTVVRPLCRGASVQRGLPHCHLSVGRAAAIPVTLAVTRWRFPSPSSPSHRRPSPPSTPGPPITCLCRAVVAVPLPTALAAGLLCVAADGARYRWVWAAAAGFRTPGAAPYRGWGCDGDAYWPSSAAGFRPV